MSRPIREIPPLALYIHLPWCRKKCPYCDFNSHELHSDAIAEERYIPALLRDIEFELPAIQDRLISNIFIGGGTPSLFSAAGLGKILTVLRSKLRMKPQLEISLEANPGTAEAQRFKAYRELGINRLSIGVQSFADGSLTALGRIHNASDALRAIQMGRQAGFEHINIDLMFALPGQTVNDALADIHTACRQPLTHISWYQLTIEPGTRFYQHPPILPADDAVWEMQTQGQAILADKGYRQYEISAYARAGGQCRHNLNYWQFGDYLGIGAGAHGKLTDTGSGQIWRFSRHRAPGTYMQKAGTKAAITEARRLSREDRMLEFMMNAMRLREGFSPFLFSARTGLSMGDIQPLLDTAVARGLVQQDSANIRATAFGRRYLNELLQIFLPAGDQ